MYNFMRILILCLLFCLKFSGLLARDLNSINMSNVTYFSICACDCIHNYQFKYNTKKLTRDICVGISGSGETLNIIGEPSYNGDDKLAISFKYPVKEILCNLSN